MSLHYEKKSCWLAISKDSGGGVLLFLSFWKNECISFSLPLPPQGEALTAVALKKRVAALTRSPPCIIREKKGEGRSVSQFGRWVRQRLKEAPAVFLCEEESNYKVQ